MKTFEVVFVKKDRSEQRTEWFEKSFFCEMGTLIEEIVEKGEKIDMSVLSIRRID